MMVEDFIDLYELQRQLRDGLEELFPGRVWVCAEIASVQVKANGHCHMDLSQSDARGTVKAKAKAVIWRSRYLPVAAYFHEATGNDLQAGMQVLLRVQVNYSEVYGLSLVVDEVEPTFTLGQAELERRRTIEKLTADGLMERQKELSLVPLPYRLAVISARDAAGYGDFKRHLTENEYGFVFQVDLFEATMQGKEAPASIVDALSRIETADGAYDAVLILRGGGSALDLACFDDSGLGFAIANCPVPVFTAIGHDKDFHVADMVAYAFVKTPTALADEFIDCYAAEDERISAFGTRLRLAFSNKVAQMESRLDQLASRIRGADPRAILSRGYSLATDAAGVVLKSARRLHPGDPLTVLFADGRVMAEVKEIQDNG